MTPVTPPSQAPQKHSSPTDPSFKEIKLRSAQGKIAPTDSRGQPLSANRPRREIKLPIRFKDCVQVVPNYRPFRNYCALLT